VSRNIKRKVAFGVSALAVAAFAGGALPATQESSNPRQAFLNDVAKRLHVTPQQLTDAMSGASVDQLNAAVAAGKLTQAQANALKQRLTQEGGGPFLLPGGPGFRGGPGMLRGGGFFGGSDSQDDPMAAAAKYLGLSETQLFNQIEAGKSLAQIATAQGKSTSGLKDAMVASIKARLDKAVAAKDLTSAQEQQMLTDFSAGLDQRINDTGVGPMHGAGRGFFRSGSGQAVPGAPGAFRYGSGPAIGQQAPVGPSA